MPKRSKLVVCALSILACGEAESSAPPHGDAGPAIADASQANDASDAMDGGTLEPPPVNLAASFVQDAVNWITTYEDAADTLILGGSQGSASVAVRNGMRNAIRFTTTDPTHQLEGASNLGMCMTAYVLKEAYPFLTTQQPVVLQNLEYLQRAVLATEQLSPSQMGYLGFPAKPGSLQYSAKTNAICGLAFMELSTFWNGLGATSYRDDAAAAVANIEQFLVRLQEPKTLPGIPAAFSLVNPSDLNGDNRYDGILEEVNNGKLVVSTATWGAIAGRFFHKRALSGAPGVDAAALKKRAQGMRAFMAAGLAVGGEHFSPTFQCKAAACAGKFAEYGSSIAKVANYSESAASVLGGDNAWHARLPRFAGDTTLFANLNGTDPVQWALNALYVIDPSDLPGSHFLDYFSDTARQVHKTNAYALIGANKRDLFLGLGTYIAHGRESVSLPGTFELDATGTTIAHYVKKDGEWQIVTSNYGDNAVAAWGASSWAHANLTLFRENPVASPNVAVVLSGKYDFGKLSHLAHWAMVLGANGRLDPKIAGDGTMTISSENLASTMCRALRIWKGPTACTL